MPREVTRWQTADGKLFETEEKAQAHVVNQACEILAKRMTLGHLTASERFRVVTTVFPDYDTAKALVQSLAHLFDD